MILPSSFDNLIINVRDVHNEKHVVTKVALKNPPQNVEGEVSPRVPHVGVVVHRGAAIVPGHSFTTLGYKNLLFSRQTVEQLKFWRFSTLRGTPLRLGSFGHGDGQCWWVPVDQQMVGQVLVDQQLCLC